MQHKLDMCLDQKYIRYLDFPIGMFENPAVDLVLKLKIYINRILQ
jgi:hypothetical protein